MMSSRMRAIPATQRLTDPDQTPTSQTATITQVKRAFKHAKSDTATGIDGCPYELWKTLNQRHRENPERNQANFDVIKTLTTVFQDIQTHASGVDKITNFALGWMCLIYKKKDRTEISNYGPITLLNTDYKLLTKVTAQLP